MKWMDDKKERTTVWQSFHKMYRPYSNDQNTWKYMMMTFKSEQAKLALSDILICFPKPFSPFTLFLYLPHYSKPRPLAAVTQMRDVMCLRTKLY